MNIFYYSCAVVHGLLALLTFAYDWVRRLVVARPFFPPAVDLLTYHIRQAGVFIRTLIAANLRRCGTTFAVSVVITMVMAHQAHAQPYFTNANSGSFFGAQQYNQSLPSPYNPSATIQRQINEGVMAGVFTNSGGGFAAVTNTYAGAFGAYTNYSAPPAAFVQAVNPVGGAPGTNAPQVLFTTTTNFAIWFGANSNLSYSLLFVGH